MTPTNEDRFNKLLESFMGHVISLDGVRLAHRHVLAELLARLPDSEFVDELIAGADATESEPGEMRRMAAHRSELDTLVRVLRFPNGERKGLVPHREPRRGR